MDLNLGMSFGSGAFSPSDLTGLKLWTKFNSGITVTGAGVSQWDDVSGEGNHLKQGTDTNRPSKEGDGSILFDGVDNFLKADAFTLVQPETIYILGKQVTWSSGARIFDGDSVLSGLLYQTSGPPNVVLYAGTGLASNSDLIIDTYSTIAAIINGASSSLKINNETETTGDAGINDMGGFTLGAAGGLTLFSNIQIKECLIYSTPHDAATRAKVIAYLSGVGGL